MMKSLIAAAAMLSFAIAALPIAAPIAEAAEPASSVDASALPKKKQTPLGLYLTPSDAHEALQASPGIVFLDVRDPIEISFVGHASDVDAIVPLAFATHEFKDKAGKYVMIGNPDFVAEARAAVARAGGDEATTIFLICRSGARSAVGTRLLAKAGFTNVWNLVEGFEGDKDKASGDRSVNGWRNAGLPWTYKIRPEAAWRGAK